MNHSRLDSRLGGVMEPQATSKNTASGYQNLKNKAIRVILSQSSHIKPAEYILEDILRKLPRLIITQDYVFHY